MHSEVRNRVLIMAALALMLASLACAQAGRVVTDAEATQLAMPTATIEVDVSAEAEYQVGEEAIVVGGSYGALVPLFANPGANFFSSQILANSPVTILLLGQDSQGRIWYQVEGQAGSGWLLGENLRPVDE
jgi:hypothetical protein